MSEGRQVHVFMLDCAGFIGSRLVGRLLEDPDVEIVGMATDYRLITPYLSHPRLTYYAGELPPDEQLIQRLLERSDVAVNLMATADARHHRDEANTILDIDLPASLALARACARANTRLVQISSGDVYNGLGSVAAARAIVGPQPVPAAAPGLPRDGQALPGGTAADACSLYASGKRLLEIGVQTSGATIDLDYTILRLFNAVGPGCDALAGWCPRHPAPLFAQLVQGIVLGQQMEFAVHPQDVYTYLHVDDAVDCIAQVTLDPPRDAERQLYNIGNPANAITPAELTRRLFDLHALRSGVRSQATVTWTPPPDRATPGPISLVPDVTPAAEALGWVPRRSLEEILEGSLDAMLAKRNDRL